MRNAARSIFVSISSGESNTPKLVLNLERVDAAGAASFLAAVADMLTQELAARDGLSLDHPLAKSVGPLSQAAAGDPKRLWKSTRGHGS